MLRCWVGDNSPTVTCNSWVSTNQQLKRSWLLNANMYNILFKYRLQMMLRSRMPCIVLPVLFIRDIMSGILIVNCLSLNEWQCVWRWSMECRTVWLSTIVTMLIWMHWTLRSIFFHNSQCRSNCQKPSSFRIFCKVDFSPMCCIKR